MNGFDSDFAQRSEQYLARTKALDAALEKSRLINGVHNLITFLTVIVGLIVLWVFPTIRWGIGLFVGLVIIRWIGNILIRVRWADPEMARINREFPAPEPRHHARSGRPLPGPGVIP